MTRCTCKTLKGVQCKKDAISGTKTCTTHKKCKSRVSKTKVSRPKKISSKKAKKSSTSSPKWVKSKAWESPVPIWLQGGEKIKTKAMSPQNADPWWLR